MNTDEHRLDLNEITEVIIRCAFAVSNTLGVGFLEKVYENALAHELQKAGLCTAQQFEIPVYYDGIDEGTCWSMIRCWWSSNASRGWTTFTRLSVLTTFGLPVKKYACL